jgi:glycosyltransferase involved in cell wall biosynthesis
MVDDANGWLIDGDIATGLKSTICDALKLDQNNLFRKKIESIEKVKQNFTWEQVIAQTITCINTINP